MANPVYPQELLPDETFLPPRIPYAAYRHAVPSGPWPWFDLIDDDAPFPLVPSAIDNLPDSVNPEQVSQAHTWRKYPELFFPNWTPLRLKKSRIDRVISQQSDRPCVLYNIDVGCDGHFSQADRHLVTKENEENFWTMMTVRTAFSEATLRTLIIANTTSGKAT